MDSNCHSKHYCFPFIKAFLFLDTTVLCVSRPTDNCTEKWWNYGSATVEEADFFFFFFFETLAQSAALEDKRVICSS